MAQKHVTEYKNMKTTKIKHGGKNNHCFFWLTVLIKCLRKLDYFSL